MISLRFRFSFFIDCRAIFAISFSRHCRHSFRLCYFDAFSAAFSMPAFSPVFVFSFHAADAAMPLPLFFTPLRRAIFAIFFRFR